MQFTSHQSHNKEVHSLKMFSMGQKGEGGGGGGGGGGGFVVAFPLRLLFFFFWGGGGVPYFC